MGYPIALPDPLTPASRALFGLAGLATTGISGDLTLTKTGTTARTGTFPDADIEVQATAEVISGNWTARNHAAYNVIASATATDPSIPAAGHEFTMLVRNGTLTTSRGSYAVSGTLVRSVWHSGSWTDYPYGPLNAANTWTAAQTFSASARFNAAEAISCGMAATAGNGIIQTASGTTKANGWAMGTDTFLWRASAGMIGVGDSATGAAVPTARHGIYMFRGGFAEPGAYATDNDGDKVILYRGDGYDARIGIGSISNMWFLSGTAGSGGIFEFYTAGSAGSATKQDTIGHNTRGFFGGAPVARQSVGAAATDAATTQTLANNLRTAFINLGLCQT